MNDKLKPCPFCGGEARGLFCTANGAYTSVYYNIKIRGLNANHSLIACGKCGCRTKDGPARPVMAAP